MNKLANIFSHIIYVAPTIYIEGVTHVNVRHQHNIDTCITFNHFNFFKLLLISMFIVTVVFNVRIRVHNSKISYSTNGHFKSYS